MERFVDLHAALAQTVACSSSKWCGFGDILKPVIYGPAFELRCYFLLQFSTDLCLGMMEHVFCCIHLLHLLTYAVLPHVHCSEQ